MGRPAVRRKGEPRTAGGADLLGVPPGDLPWLRLLTRCFCFAASFSRCTQGAVFGWGQAQALTILNTFDFLSPQAATVLSGGCGGFVQGIIMSPCLLLKTRVMTDPRFRSTGGVLQTTIASGKLGREIVVKEGISVLTKGMGVFSFKRFCDWTTRYLFVELVADAIRVRAVCCGATRARCAQWWC